MTESLHLHRVSYRYPKTETDALQDLEIDFPAGSFTVLMGSAGAGKSTLLMSLNGVIPQLKQGTLTGSVSLDGADLANYRVQTITGYVGLVLQDPESQVLGGRSLRMSPSARATTWCRPLRSEAESPNAWRWSSWLAWKNAPRWNSPVASCNGSRSPGSWRFARKCSAWTSPPRNSTRRVEASSIRTSTDSATSGIRP